MLHKAAFLDRDGVINADRAYVYRQEDFEILPGVFDAARQLSEAGYLLVVVTNQSGIGRGYYSEADFWQLTDAMKNAFQEAGAPIAGVYFCPHHPSNALDAYRCDCHCRKPKPGMFFDAARDLNIDLSASLMIGDGARDLQAAQAAGVPVRILVGKNACGTPEAIPESTMTAASLQDAATRFLTSLR